MASPDLGTGAKLKQWADFVGVPSCDDDHTGTAIVDDFLEECSYCRIGESLLPIETEWRESSIIVEQKRGNRRLCYRVHELLDFDWIDRAAKPHIPHPQAAELARGVSVLLSDESRRSSQSSPIRLP